LHTFLFFMFTLFLYDIGAYLMPTAENPREPKWPALWQFGAAIHILLKSKDTHKQI
jgi:hypothetical protein